MPNRRRYFLTTAIAYANNRPGLHTLYEVVAADVLARWHRMIGDDTRFLTGTDEYSVNIAMTAEEQGKTPKAFVDEMVELFRTAEAGLGISPDRFIRTTDPDHQRAVHEFIRRAYAKGDLYPSTYEGWYCPNEGFVPKSQLVEDAVGTHCANHPTVALQWLTERNWFFRLSKYQAALERHYAEHPDWVQPEFRKNEMLGFMAGGLEDFSASRQNAKWGIPFPIAENGESALREDGTWDPEAGTVYVWFDALINYITGAGFPDDPKYTKWWPADLHVIGKDINRLHTIMWPAMLMSADLPLPKRVWVHGWLLAQGERMSKSRGNFLDPNDVVAALGTDGARFVMLREVAFDRDSDVSWDSFVRRYNADLANDFGNLVNRTVAMAGRYLDGERPAPTRDGSLAASWAIARERMNEHLEACLLHEALASLWTFVGDANRFVDAEKPWDLNKAAQIGDADSAARLRGVLGDLIEACRVIALAAAPFMPNTAPRVLTQLGYVYPYGPDGNGGPLLHDELRWGALGNVAGHLTAPEPLFPRLDVATEAG
jgi:methionyl-tRNA synthetase